MKKQVIAFSLIAATAGVAHAQSNVQIYGIVDAGFAKSSVDAAGVLGSAGARSDVLRMTEKINSRLGFSGTEDLGGGLKATFQLEHRFKPFDGSTSGRDLGSDQAGTMFEGASNVGLAGNWGAVRFGRLNNVLDETIRSYDPFAEFGVASHIVTTLGYARQSSTVRYDSPIFNGFSFSANYELKNQNNNSVNDGTTANANDGYGATAKYNNGPVSLAVGYDKKANTNDSYQWSVAGSYTLGQLKASFIYDDAKNKNAAEIDENNWQLGLAYKIGAGTVNGIYQRLNWEQGTLDRTDKRYALGYTHDLSKRTSVYAEYSHTTGDRVELVNGDDSYNAFSVGMTHKF